MVGVVVQASSGRLGQDDRGATVWAFSAGAQLIRCD